MPIHPAAKSPGEQEGQREQEIVILILLVPGVNRGIPADHPLLS